VAQEFYNYDPAQIICVAANKQIQGFADGSFIKVRALSPGFTSKAGADALVSHSRTNDPRVEVTIILMAGSADNDTLSTVHELDLDTPGGAGVFPFSLTDLNGRSVLEMTYCRVMKAPDEDISKEDGVREWVLEGRKDRRITGGR
jgi:hypothetical protein